MISVQLRFETKVNSTIGKHQKNDKPCHQLLTSDANISIEQKNNHKTFAKSDTKYLNYLYCHNHVEPDEAIKEEHAWVPELLSG